MYCSWIRAFSFCLFHKKIAVKSSATSGADICSIAKRRRWCFEEIARQPSGISANGRQAVRTVLPSRNLQRYPEQCLKIFVQASARKMIFKQTSLHETKAKSVEKFLFRLLLIFESELSILQRMVL